MTNNNKIQQNLDQYLNWLSYTIESKKENLESTSSAWMEERAILKSEIRILTECRDTFESTVLKGVTEEDKDLKW